MVQEEVVISVRTEVQEAQEGLENLRGEMSKTQKEAEKTAKSAEKMGKQVSSSASEFSNISKDLGTISPMLGNITKSVTKLSNSVKKLGVNVNKVGWRRKNVGRAGSGGNNSDMTDMGSTIGHANKTGSVATNTSKLTKVAGVVGIAAIGASLFNAISGSGAKLAAFDRLNTLGEPSILDGILRNTDKIAENTTPGNASVINPVIPPLPDITPSGNSSPRPSADTVDTPAVDMAGVADKDKDKNTQKDVWSDVDKIIDDVRDEWNKKIGDTNKTPTPITVTIPDDASKSDESTSSVSKLATTLGEVLSQIASSSLVTNAVDKVSQFGKSAFNWLLEQQKKSATSQTSTTDTDTSSSSKKTEDKSLTDTLGDLWGGFTDTVGSWAGGAVDAIGGAVDTATDFIGSLIPDEVAQLGADFGNAMAGAGIYLGGGDPLASAMGGDVYSAESARQGMAGFGLDAAVSVFTGGLGKFVSSGSTVLKSLSKTLAKTAEDTKTALAQTLKSGAEAITEGGIKVQASSLSDAIKSASSASGYSGKLDNIKGLLDADKKLTSDELALLTEVYNEEIKFTGGLSNEAKAIQDVLLRNGAITEKEIASATKGAAVATEKTAVSMEEIRRLLSNSDNITQDQLSMLKETYYAETANASAMSNEAKAIENVLLKNGTITEKEAASVAAKIDTNAEKLAKAAEKATKESTLSKVVNYVKENTLIGNFYEAISKSKLVQTISEKADKIIGGLTSATMAVTAYQNSKANSTTSTSSTSKTSTSTSTSSSTSSTTSTDRGSTSSSSSTGSTVLNLISGVAKVGTSIYNGVKNGLKNLLGFAEGGVFMPNQPQLAVLGDNKSEPEVAAPYSMIVRAVEDALRSSQSRESATTSTTRIEVPITLNGKVIARGIYDDLESEKRRRNGSAVM